MILSTVSISLKEHHDWFWYSSKVIGVFLISAVQNRRGNRATAQWRMPVTAGYWFIRHDSTAARSCLIRVLYNGWPGCMRSVHAFHCGQNVDGDCSGIDRFLRLYPHSRIDVSKPNLTKIPDYVFIPFTLELFSQIRARTSSPPPIGNPLLKSLVTSHQTQGILNFFKCSTSRSFFTFCALFCLYFCRRRQR